MRRLAVPSLLLALTLVAAGCTGGPLEEALPEATPTPSPAPSPAPTPTPEPTPTPTPSPSPSPEPTPEPTPLPPLPEGVIQLSELMALLDKLMQVGGISQLGDLVEDMIDELRDAELRAARAEAELGFLLDRVARLETEVDLLRERLRGRGR